ncbi:LytR C-terminal domain-containing protein [Nocardia transvalensis]|uniref:LytR C-terminal domain-containing protein n=1 Tax=Nocardia transvalensis TaxID=37333 RepID=UPI00189537F3|nr:LytR C-terminal domain-containing protein [Nocardia transvalensis]MBF6329146.1 LytR C-terminal domain-containing protein [Nocardia transvalensis]
MSNPNPSSGGPPLRALAMVLIALAIVFAGLGAMSLSKSDADNSDTSTQGQTVKTTAAMPTTSAAAITTTRTATTTPPPTTTTTAPPTTTAAVLDKSVPVRVLNNSTISGLAARTGNQLSTGGWNVAETGNYSDSVVPKTTVYYGNSPKEQAAAQAIANTLGVTAEPRFPGIVDAPPGVIVIVTGN